MKVVNMNMSAKRMPGTINKMKPTTIVSISRMEAPRNFRNGRGCHKAERSAASGLSCAER